MFLAKRILQKNIKRNFSTSDKQYYYIINELKDLNEKIKKLNIERNFNMNIYKQKKYNNHSIGINYTLTSINIGILLYNLSQTE